MRKINYRITVNITQKTMKLGFRAKMPDEMQGKRIRVQAVFTQRQVERRFPMEVVIEEGEVGDQIRADAEILLPYVFYSPPRHKVNVIFTLWCGEAAVFGPTTTQIMENGVRYEVDFENGQKTGFFLDQKYNRRVQVWTLLSWTAIFTGQRLF